MKYIYLYKFVESPDRAFAYDSHEAADDHYESLWPNPDFVSREFLRIEDEAMQSVVLTDWPYAIFISREQWLSCLEHPDEVRRHYEDWLNRNDAILYLVRIDDSYSIGARYGLEKHEYLAPYANQVAMKKLYEGE